MGKKKVPSLVKDEKLIQKRREEMVKAAVGLFKDKGFHRTTTREIAKAAGFSIGTLYEYIRSKEDVLYLVCDSIYDEVRSRLQSEIVMDQPGINRLKEAIVAYFKVMDEMQDEVLVMYQEAKSLSDEALPYVLRKELEMTAIFERLIQRSVDAGNLFLSEEEVNLLAHNILIQGQMWTFRRWALQKSHSLETYTQFQIELLLNGIEMNRKTSSV
ncbi:TetR/AcrR family transcriptional regulator [Pseudalkalibacillus salsuginis]|uniref:TetR/AcrR family transcriptional regulator n=1 Tax=Pseudalkalibacillus salsuginis TaxID=2910972 RepID=UPI001F3F6A0B|nr:TetR/AcrR family transcriptional regulator [Pseudalkalibacillus salsuginis]MCF6410894.1 TetR/AcrR family transcriptional regulator [Pseudalkalibacillus salsuginis]